ncbi:MAG: CoA-binding protein [Deltaproteobacteria bacterium]|nr:CoA-binding protein [Deltaproteobacteria bacterium]
MNFEALFRPKTMAVVGVSLTNDRHPANVIYNKNNLRYQAEVFAVNRRGGVFQGKTVYPSLGDIPRKVDLAVIVTRAELVPTIVRESIQAGASGAVIISGGFAESGRGDLQEELVSSAREADFPFIGPNCLGIYSPPYIDTLFIPPERIVRPDKGRVALVSQSGGLLVDQMVKFAAEGVGLSQAVSIGNKALVRECELLEYFARDPQTEAIAFYGEGFGRNEGREFVSLAARCPKPVIVLKSGKTPGGTRAISSHTASMAGDYDVFCAVLAQHGVVEAKNEFELISFCEALSCYSKPVEGRVAIITASGGHGALAADACLSHGLSVPALPEQDQQEIRQKVSPRLHEIASFRNPVDLTGSAVDDDFMGAAEVLSTKAGIDCVLLLLLPYVPGITSDLGARMSQIYRQEDKPLIAYVPHVERYRMFIEGFELNQIPVAHSIEGAVHMAEALRRQRSCSQRT